MPRTAWIAIVAGLAVIAGLYAYYRWDELAGDAELAQRPVTLPEKETAPAPVIRHPIPSPPPPAARTEDEAPAPDPLPPLNESDPALRNDLDALFGSRPVESFLIPKRIVGNTVVAIDNLDHKALSLRHWPVKHVEGQPAVEKRTSEGGEERLLLTADNAGRYDAHVAVLRAVDAERLADLYVRYYPLFQEAYENLGYPDRYFNDRLIALIDHLLATPEVPYPIELRQPEVLYEFADPALEALSWGQKTLIRMGPSHMATIKTKLREIRAAILARTAAADGG